MERHFTIPVTVAAALHGAVLFGFRDGSGSQVPPPDTASTILFEAFPVPEPEVPKLFEAAESGSAKGSTEPLLPRGDDRSLPGPGLEMPIPPRVPIRLNGPKKIDAGEIGVFDGLAEVGRGNLLGSGDLDAPPRARVQVPPLYPPEARRHGMSGEVVVAFVVDESGRVLNPQVLKASDRMFEEPALRAVARWRFEPGTRHGQVVRFRMAVPVIFSIGE